jgi:hypothetical protein
MMKSTSAFQHLGTPPGFAKQLLSQSARPSAHANAEVLIAEMLTSGGVSRSVLTC